MVSTVAPLRALGRRLGRRPATIVGLVLLPLLIVAGFLWATSGTGSRLHQTEAAVVNLDEGATVKGKPVHLGQDYALQLKNQTGPNFTWRYGVSAAEANAGLAAGRFSAAVVIPPGFSRVLTGTAQDATRDQATLTVERSPVSGVSDQLVVNELSMAATHSLSGQVTRGYLDDIFVSTAELGTALGRTTTLAQDARSNAAQLDGQATSASRATSSLASSAAQANQGATGVASSATQAADSVAGVGSAGGSASAGASQAVTGSQAQAKAIQAAAEQARGVQASAKKASSSATDAATRAKDATSQGDATRKGADAVASAAAANTTAAAGYTGRVASVVQQQKDLAARLAATSAAVKGYATTTETVAGAVGTARSALADAAAPTPELPQTQQPGIAPSTPATPTGATSAEQLRTVAAQLDALGTAITTQTGSGGLTQQQAQLDAAADDAARVATQSQALASSAHAASSSNADVLAAARQVAQAADTAQTQLAQVRATLQGATAGGDERHVGAPTCPYRHLPERGLLCRIWQEGYAKGYQAGTAAAGSPAQVAAAIAQLDQAVATVKASGSRADAAVASAQATATQLDALAKAADANAADAKKLAASLATASTALKGYRDELGDAPARLAELSATLGQVADAVENSDGGQVQQKVAVALQALDTAPLNDALDALPQQRKAVDGALAAQQQAVEQNQQAMAAVDPAKGGAKELTAGAATVSTVSARQAEAVQKLQTQLASLNTGMGQLSTAMGGLGKDATALTTSTGQVSDGATVLAGQVQALTGTIRAVQAAADTAAADARTTAVRASTLQQQISSLQQSSSLVSSQSSAVAQTASSQLARSQAVQQQVARNQAQLPSYDEQTRQQLTSAVSHPITTADEDSFRNIGWVSMLMVLALWAGAMGLHSVFAPVSNAARRSTASPLRLLVQEMMPAVLVSVLQALAVSAVGQAALHLPSGRWAVVTAALVVAAVCFAAVNHSLVAFARMFGRLVAVAFALVSAASLITQAYPDAMHTLRLFSPLTPALDLVRLLMTGAPGAGMQLLALLSWLGAGALFSALAILRARDPEPVRVPSVYAS